MDNPRVQPIKKNSLSLMVIITVLALVIIGAAYLLGHKHKSTATTSESVAIPRGWMKYEAKQYGFKFAYPKEWSAPNVQRLTNKGQVSYQVIIDDKKGFSVITLLNKAQTATNIKNALAGDKKGFLKYDSSSYSTALIDSSTDSIGQVDLLQTVSLNKLGISVASVEVILNSSKDCPNHLVAGSSSTCFTEDDYKNVTTFAKNIKSL
jgi:hypothetical protein